MTEVKDLPNDERYLIFQALSHPTRVRILSLLASEGLSFASLKRELGMESSGQLQHHLQKLSGLIEETPSGSYGLTTTGTRALEIYRESEKSGSTLAQLCCLPAQSDLARDKQINGRGVVLRLSIGSVLSLLTAGIVANYFLPNQAYLKAFEVFGGSPLGAWVDAIVFGFFGISFLISSFTGYPGCEITAIPNLFTRSKVYCSCFITPFNVPNGGLLERKPRGSYN